MKRKRFLKRAVSALTALAFSVSTVTCVTVSGMEQGDFVSDEGQSVVTETEPVSEKITFYAEGISRAGSGYAEPEQINGVYQITSSADLCWFAEHVNSGNKSAGAVLTADIDMSGVEWTTICETGLYYNEYGEDFGYSGTFDGNGHTISNLKVKSSTTMDASVGLFGTVSGTVKNLGMVDFTFVDGGKDVRAGAIVGQLITASGKISNCFVNGADIQTGDHVAGGIVGCVYEATVENCYAVNTTITGYGDRYGCIAGDVRADGGETDRPGYIKNCFTDGNALTSSYKSDDNIIGNKTNVTEKTFKSGEITYLLNGSPSENAVWYQTLGTDSYPVLDNARGVVYVGYDACKASYANSSEGLNPERQAHNWDDGVCSVCDLICEHEYRDGVCTVCSKIWTSDITVKPDDGEGFVEGEYNYENGVHTINTDKAVTISGKTITETVVVASGVSANITLSGVNIDVSGTDNACAFKIADNSTGNVKITLVGENILKSGKNCAGLQKNGKNTDTVTVGNLTITGDGSLKATGGFEGAGIGGGSEGAGTDITINGGTVTATGGFGAGIGGGYHAEGSGITINGGTVTAIGADFGAGIGGGSKGTGTDITINGGTVTATGGFDGAGIGGGYYEEGSGITINGGTVTATGCNDGAGIGGGDEGAGTDITINGGSVKASAGTSANAIGGGRCKSPVTPTNKSKESVYLLEIINEDGKNIVINYKDYPDSHGKEKKIYAYLPAKTEEYGNRVAVGEKVTCYYYDEAAWKVHTDENKDDVCDICGGTVYIYGPDQINGVYQITSSYDLCWFAEYVNSGNKSAEAVLTADIYMSGVEWTIMSSFAGVFDGNGYTVYGLNGHNLDTGDTHGFIRTLANSGVVKNITFSGANVFNHEGNGATSAVIAYTNQGTIENCVVANSNIQHGNYDSLGVVVGINSGMIRNCASISNIITRRYNSSKAVCGFVWDNKGNIENCFNYDCTYQNGVDHYAFTQSNTGTITNCYYYEKDETLSDTAVTVVTADRFESGEAAYLLNGSSSENAVWYQTLGTDPYPVLDNTRGVVYMGYDACKVCYANSYDGLNPEGPVHNWDDGVCSVCDLICEHEYRDGVCTVCSKIWTDITVKPDDGKGFAEGEYSYADGVHTINTDKAVTIWGKTTTETVVVASGVSANITLSDVNIDVSGTGNACAFKIADNSTGNVKITLVGENILKSGENCAGLQKNGKNTDTVTVGNLTITGDGSLTATGGYSGAGIGGGDAGTGTDITINGGTVTATSGNYGAGIGGGDGGTGSDITINGGTVTATGGNYGAGIGGGDERAGTDITINGGTVTAIGGYAGAGIGGVYFAEGSGITINGGTVTATGGDFGAGIGGGDGGTGTDITINGGSVKAIAGNSANAIGGGRDKDPVTPTNKSKESVYLLEITNEDGKDILINYKDYPDSHGEEKKIYAYLPAKTEEYGNRVAVGEKVTCYYYDEAEWKTGCLDHTDENKDDICDICGGTAYRYAALGGYTISLNGNIGVNFYIELSEKAVNDTGAYMLFTLPDGSEKKVSVSEAVTKTVNEKTYYVFSCEVSSYEMTQDIVYQMFDGEGNSSVSGRYTVREYAEYIIRNHNSYSVDDVAFAKALLNYGAAAQEYWDVSEDAPANNSMSEEDKLTNVLDASVLESYKATAASNEQLGKFSGYSLTLKSETTLKAYFEPTAGVDVNNLVFTADGETVTPVKSGKGYVLSVENIKAWDLNKNYKFTASDGNTILEFSCSALSYGYSVLRGDYEEELDMLISALYDYCMKSECYAN